MYRRSIGSTSQTPPPEERITFSREDMSGHDDPFCDALVIQTVIENFTVSRILIDNGSSVNIIFKKPFDVMQVEAKRVLASDGPLFGFSGERKVVEGGVGLHVSLGGESRNCRFVIVEAPNSYNAIFGRPLINAFRCVPSSFNQCLKFNVDGIQVRVRGDPKVARECYVTAVNSISWQEKAEGMGRRMEEMEGQEAGEEGGEEGGMEGEAREEILPEGSVGAMIPGGGEVLTPRGEDTAEWEEQSRLEAAEEVVEMEVLTQDGRVEKVRISGGLTPEDQGRMLECIQKNEDVFAWSAAEMPGIDADVVCHRLNLHPEARPIQQKRRSVTDKLAEPIREEVAKLLKAGFVSEIQYPGWVSNVVMVKKGDGRWRMCVDFSLLNKSCPKDCYPLPRIDALVDSAVGFSVMSFLDAFSGYHQIRMHPPDIKNVSFITGDGCYCYKMMPFGLKNAGATYQKMMDRVFQGQRGRNLEVYVDDLMVKSREVDSHLQDLEETFGTLRKYKMRLNPLKCIFGASKGKFLGHLLTLAGVEPNPDKVRAIMELGPPRDAKEVQRLTGKLAGLSRFLSRAGERCSPFFKTLRGGRKFEWTPECEEAFQALKRQLTQAPLLQGPKEGEDLFLYLGVGAEAVSSVLVREEGRKQLPIYYVSRVLRKAELRYPILEKLAFALIISARRLRPYFQAHSIQVITDHPLRSIFEGVEHSGRLAKWSVELSEFDISFVPRLAIKAQAMADFLADYVVEVAEDKLTYPVPWKVMVDGASGKHSLGVGVVLESPQGTRIEQTVVIHFSITNNQAEYEEVIAGLRLAKELGVHDVKVFTDSMVVASQINGEFEAREPTLQRYLAKVKGIIGGFQTFSIQHVPREENEQVDHLAKRGLRVGGTITDLFHPSLKEEELMEIDRRSTWMDPFTTYLSTGEYPEGMDRKKLKYKSAYYLLRDGQLYRKTLSGLLARCVAEGEVSRILEEVHSGECGSHSGVSTVCPPPTATGSATQEYHVPLAFRNLGNGPGRSLPLGKRAEEILAGNDRLFLQVDGDEGFGQGALQIIRNFLWGDIICRHGMPQAIVTDNGPQFASNEFIKFCGELGIDLRFASVHHPRSNGQVEAANKIIVNLLKKKVENLKGNWVEQLPSVLWALRTTPNTATGETPFKLSHGSEAVLPIELEVRTPRVAEAEAGREEWRDENEGEQRLSLDLIEEVRDLSAVRQEEVKRRMAKYFDKHVRVKQFVEGDLVLKKVDAAGRSAVVGKLHPNWEGPYIVKETLKSGGYHLQNVEGETLRHTWSGDDLKRFYP
ncbi:hypothetical protein KSP39_PZI019849 [Platanthera zijinensis]|uniref:Uncharacterized protein n=1 Tax=Platanthera zijinensis TaxID=2320716 RepID=A0AAP0B127_9ASPA